MRVASWVIQVSPSPAPSTPAGFRRAQPSTEPIQSRSYAATVSSSPVPSTAAGFRRAQPSTEQKQSRSYSDSLVKFLSLNQLLTGRATSTKRK
mmetsp:Transcript_88654/g.239874  ORF Transcript_88654/g.239874 Transcript_88654/m.239874 type:complete len:93 (+) Transcript_88654:481-759(+)